MSDNEKQIGQTLTEAVADLPDEKKQYFIGFAEGVAAMASQVKTNTGSTEEL